MRRARHAFAVGSLCATVLLPASGSPPAAQAGVTGAAMVTQDAVIAADVAPSAVDDQVALAGTTGFLHMYDFGGQYLWTDYATGHSVSVPGLPYGAFTSAGGDTVAVTLTSQVNPAGDVSELDLSTMTWRHWVLPSGAHAFAVAGNSVLVRVVSGGTPAWRVLTFAADGSNTVTDVTGLPSGAVMEPPPPGLGDAAAMVVKYYGGSGVSYGLLDLATATVALIPGASGQPVALTADRVTFYNSGTETVSVYSRAGLLAGTDTSPQTVALPGATGFYETALAGDHVVAVPGTNNCQSCAYTVKPLLDVPLSGAAGGQVLPQAQTGTESVAQAADGSALVVGGTGPADWSVRRLATDSGGELTDAPVLALTGPLTNAGLSVSAGVLRHIEAEPVPGGAPAYRMFNHELIPGNDGVSSIPLDLDGGTLTSPLPCAPGASCVRTIDGNSYGLSYLAPDTATSITLWQRIDARTSTMSNSLPSAGGALVDAALGYVIVNGVNPSRQYVVDVGHEKILSTGPVTGAALWFGTLWRTAGAGRLRATDLDRGTTAAPVATGANCAATEIQATRRWVYWSCGASGPAGVYDQWTKRHFAVPAGPMLLGDGYLVRHDAGTGALVMYDVHADAVAAPVTLATVPSGPAPDDRGITWAVDKYSGDVAYVAADDSVHVLNVGVPAAPPRIAAPSPLTVWDFSPAKNGGWYASLVLSRPVTSWRLTIRKAGTSAVVHAESGGGATVMWPHWNGYLPGGAQAYSGRYNWSLSVVTPRSGAPVTVPGGTLLVECGRLPFRSYDCAGEPSLLADAGGYTGESHWFNGTPSGGLTDNGYTDNWQLCSSRFCDSAIVPFGDLNGDGYGDLLVRTRDGKLRGYLGLGQPYFGNVKSVSLGSGWNAYNALVYAGDLNRDGHPDLVARDGKGRLWLFAGTGKGRFRTRVEIGGGWGGYVRLIGAGDLTGDGTGDLLAIDRAGVMWRYAGNGHGGFLRRHRLSSGWSRYNAVIGIGDLSVDGCNDLVARDVHGTLWRFDGNCAGGFRRPVKISGGWGKYQGLF